MKKNDFLLVLICSLTLNGCTSLSRSALDTTNTQTDNSPAAVSSNSIRVSYRFITHLRAAPIEQNADLLIENGRSVFEFGKGPEGFVTQEVELKQPDGSLQKAQDGYWQDPYGNVYFKDLKSNTLVIREIVWMQPYLATEPQLPKINWEITQEQKKIGTFDCQKATTRFRGRNYTAWFSPQIPVSDGPWKFHGLPGLILEAYDSEEQVQFLFTEIESPYSAHEPIVPPTNGKKVSFEDYKRADELELEKMRQKTMSAQERQNNMKIERVNKNLLEREYEH